ncbi:MAG: DUF4340 domain-containing protein [Spirochaetales bacterium]
MRRNVALWTMATVSVLLLVTLWFGVLQDRQPRASARLVSEQQLAELSGVEFLVPDGSTRLRRSTRGWVLDEGGREFPAREPRITLLVDAVRTASVLRIATSDSSRWSQFGVGRDAPVIRFAASGGEFDLVVGNPTAADGTFVRVGGEPEVYEVDVALKFFTEQRSTYWLLLRMLPAYVRPDDVVAMRFRTSGALRAAGAPDSLDLIRGSSPSLGDRWLIVGSPRSGDREMSLLNGLEFVSQTIDLVGASFWLGDWEALDPAGRIDVELGDGRTYTLVIRGVGPFVIMPQGRDLPADGFGGLRYVVDAQRLVRATDPTLAID